MKIDEDKLKKLLHLVKQIVNAPENASFKRALYELISDKSILNPQPYDTSLESKIKLIQEYLAIDVKVLIDYSYFKEPTREQLFRDNLEMMRYQKGTPNHKVNFGEFCRYAHLQAEELINYFLFYITDGKMESVESFIKQYFPKYNPGKQSTEIHQINYTSKIIAFKEAYKLDKGIFGTLKFISEVRNEMSHRNSNSLQKEDEELAKCEKEGFLKFIDYNDLDQEQKYLYNKGQYIIKKRKEDFKVVVAALNEFKESVIDALRRANNNARDIL